MVRLHMEDESGRLLAEAVGTTDGARHATARLLDTIRCAFEGFGGTVPIWCSEAFAVIGESTIPLDDLDVTFSITARCGDIMVQTTIVGNEAAEWVATAPLEARGDAWRLLDTTRRAFERGAEVVPDWCVEALRILRTDVDVPAGVDAANLQ